MSKTLELFISDTVKRFFQSVSESDIDNIQSLVKEHGTNEQIEIFSRISQVSKFNIDAIGKHGAAMLEDLKNGFLFGGPPRGQNFGQFPPAGQFPQGNAGNIAGSNMQLQGQGQQVSQMQLTQEQLNYLSSLQAGAEPKRKPGLLTRVVLWFVRKFLF